MGTWEAMHYYSHHIGDFVRDTANLDDHQLATYLRLMWAYYDSEKPISGELEDVAFAMRSDEKTVRLLLRHYFTESPDGWRHTRCDREIQAFHDKQDKAQKSANARWKNADALRAQSERNATEQLSDANQEPRTKNQEKNKSSAGKPAPFDPSGLIFQSENLQIVAAWETWIAYRKALSGKKLQEASWRGQADNFREWFAEGLDVNAIVKYSIDNAYTGLFPDRFRGRSAAASKQSTLEARNAAVAAEWLKNGEQHAAA